MNNRQETKQETQKLNLPNLSNSKTHLQNLQKLFNKINRTINQFVSLICPPIIQLKIQVREKIYPICPFKKKA